MKPNPMNLSKEKAVTSNPQDNGLSAENAAVIDRLRKILAISPNTAELLTAAWSQTNALLNAARDEARSTPSEREVRLEAALQQIARADTPPHQNGHYLQARNAVMIARSALSSAEQAAE